MSGLDDTVRAASPIPIIVAGAKLAASAPAYPFLDHGSPLHTDPHRYIENLLKATIDSEDRQHLAEYVTIAVSWHCLEGWRYLSHAGMALLGGSRRAAIHMAYYAELRAARSLLASSGICIRDGLHFGLDSSGDVLRFGAPKEPLLLASEPTIACALAEVLRQLARRLGRRSATKPLQAARSIGTHVAAARALKRWSKVSANGSRVIDAMRGLQYRGIDWVEAVRLSAMRDSVAAEWLSDWSIDLRALKKDSDERNIASYGVSLRSSALDPVSEEEVHFIRAMNESWLSIDVGNADSLDLTILHDFLVKAGAVIAEAESDDRKPIDLWTRLHTYLTGPGRLEAEDADSAIEGVRTAEAGPGGTVLRAAKVGNRDAMGVLARALLLLRLASALLLAQWREMAKRSPGGVVLWHAELVRQYANHTHLADTTVSLADYRDLVEDQAEALDELDRWLTAGPMNSMLLWRDKSAVLCELCRFERAFLVAAAS